MSERLPVGYRRLTAEEIDLINSLKAEEAHALIKLDRFKDNPEVNQRSLSLARTKLQEAYMWYIRAIARPNGE